jgi:dihydroflavonol-4-reductase
MQRVFITGGTGLLGSSIIRELLKRQYSVTALVEETVNPFTIHELSVDIFRGDILKPESYESEMAKCDFVIHSAASTSVWPNRSEIVNKINIEGTQNICNSARNLGLKKIIHVGTANTFGFGSKSDPGNELIEFNSGAYGLDYIDSKYKVHHWILEQVKTFDLPATIVNPTFMIGPNDTKPSSGEMIRSFYQGKIFGYTPGGRNFIYSCDAAIGVVNALEKGKIGESYILGNQNLNYKEFFKIVSDVLDKKPPKFSPPKWLMMTIATLNTFIARIGGFAPRLYPTMVTIAFDEQFFSAEKAVREIDLPQTPIDVAIKNCFNWLNDNNYL